VTLSVGVCSAKALDDGSIAALVAATDAALYEAKRSGRNRVASAPPRP
jgi:PleD family two-component response regulator